MVFNAGFSLTAFKGIVAVAGLGGQTTLNPRAYPATEVHCVLYSGKLYVIDARASFPRVIRCAIINWNNVDDRKGVPRTGDPTCRSRTKIDRSSR